MQVGSKVRLLRPIQNFTDTIFVLTVGSIGEVVKIYPADDSLYVIKFAGQNITFYENEIGKEIEEVT